ncbi:MAG: DUF3445 domain-containing protein [Rhodobacteraceae bacterium]|nr:DUF3445 domain-containing protein [Paracoccaceae bacterium]
MSAPILQSELPHAPWMTAHTARLPGIQPAEEGSWVLQDDAFAGQMARRDALIAERLDDVHQMRPAGEGGAAELYESILTLLRQCPGYAFGTSQVLRPDGIAVDLDPSRPLVTLGRLVQEDFCILTPSTSGHVLSAAILCFPASWTLKQKIGRPMGAIHTPVESYTPEVERRVQRLFDALRVGRPLWRSNALMYNDAELYQPRREDEPPRDRATPAAYLRSERQTLFRLPKTDAVVFSIHTVVIRARDLTGDQRAGLAALEVVS